MLHSAGSSAYVCRRECHKLGWACRLECAGLRAQDAVCRLGCAGSSAGVRIECAGTEWGGQTARDLHASLRNVHKR